MKLLSLLAALAAISTTAAGCIDGMSFSFKPPNNSYTDTMNYSRRWLCQ